MSAPSVTGQLQIGGASLVSQTIDAAGGSMPFVFQHGMGGDANQALGYIGDAPSSAKVGPPLPRRRIRAECHTYQLIA
jgi:hypothetical protein